MKDINYVMLAIAYAIILLPMQYTYNFVTSPNGKVVIDPQDSTYLALAKSVSFGFRSPWIDPDTNVFNDIILGSPYSILPIGFLWYYTGIDPWPVMIILTTIFTIGYLIAILEIMKKILPRGEWKIAFPILLFANGIGGLLYVPFLFTEFSKAGIANLFWGWMTSNSIYQTFTLLTGYTGFYYLIENKKSKSFLMMAITVLVYPTFGFLFLAMSFLYSIVNKKAVSSLKILMPSALFFLPWIFFISQNTIPYETLNYFYKTPINFPLRFIFTFVVNSGVGLVFGLYSLKDNKSLKEKKYLFLLLWTFILVSSILIQTIHKTTDVYKLLVMYWVPLSMLGSIGILKFSKRYRLNPKLLGVFLIAISFPSFILFYSESHVNDTGFIDQEIYDALTYLKGMPQGTVLSNSDVGKYIPYFAEKRTVLGKPLESSEARDVYKEFYSGDLTIVKDYNLRYIIQTENEILPNNLNTILIYSNSKINIYKIV